MEDFETDSASASDCFSREEDLYIERQVQPRPKLPTSGAQRLSRNRVGEMWNAAGLMPREETYSVGSAEPGAVPRRRSRPATALSGSTQWSGDSPTAAAAAQPLRPASAAPRLQASTSYTERRVKHSAQALRTAILNEIVERRCYEEKRLNQLLRSYLQLNSGEAFYDTLCNVVAQLRVELDIRS